MKFKIIFALFNIVVLFSFIIIFFMPLIMLGWSYTREFWASNWYLPVLFIGIMGILNAYFISNWRLFSLLENEDWTGIKEFTLTKLQEGKLKKQYVKVLINSSLVTSDLESIKEAEKIVRERKPAWIKDFIIAFGVPYMLGNDPASMEAYYRQFLEIETDDREWVQWNYSFSLVLQKRFEEAKTQLVHLADNAHSPVVLALTGYLISAYSGGDHADAASAADNIRSHLTEEYTKEKWARVREKEKDNVQLALLSKLLEDATNWVFDQQKEKPADGAEIQ